MATWEIEVTDPAGVAFGSLAASSDSCSLDNIVHELNEPSTAQITISAFDPKFSLIWRKEWTRYIRIFRDGNIRFWGPITRISPTGDGSQFVVQAKDPLAILKHRFMGPTPSITEFGYPTCVGTGVKVITEFPAMTGTAVLCTATSSSEWRASGSASLKLVYGVSGAQSYYEYTFSYTTGGPGVAAGYLTFYLVAWAYLASITAPAASEAGLLGYTEYPAATVYDMNWAPINMATPVGVPVPLEVAFKVPTGPVALTSTIHIRFYCPNGTIYWDNANVYMQRSVGANGGTFTDYGTIIDRLIEYASGDTAEAVTLGKSDLNWARSVATCGITDNRFYDLASNQNIYEALMEYVERNLYDFAVLPNAAGTQSTFYGYTPRKGSYKPELALELGRNIAAAPSLAIDGDQVVNKPRVLGRGDGPSREVFEDMSTTDLGGLTLESVETAPSDAAISSMQYRAAEALRLGVSGVSVTEVTCKEGAGTQLISGGLSVGDTVPFLAAFGQVNESATVRVIRITELPDDTVKLGLNDE